MFETRETSRKSGSPVTLYLFRYGADPDAYEAYTDAVDEVSIDDGRKRMLYISMDVSSYMDGARLSNLKTMVNDALDDIGTEIANGLSIDIALNLWNDSTSEEIRTDADASDITALKAIVTAATASGSPNFDNAVSGAASWFTTSASDDTIGRRAAIILIGGAPTSFYEPSDASVIDMLDHSEGTLNGIDGTAVDVYAINVEFEDTSVSEYLDNTPQDGVPVIASNDSAVLTKTINRAVLNTITFEPVAVKHGPVVASGTLDKSALSIKLPRSAAMVSFYAAVPPAYSVTLVIRQGHLEDTDKQFPVVWSGRVLNMAYRRNEAEFTCEPISTALKRAGLRRNYQYGCPHALYGRQCRASKTAATISVNASGISGNILQLPASWNSIALAKYVGGIVEWTKADGNTEIRTIMGLSGTQDLRLNATPTGVTAGLSVKISLGCNHTTDDCENLHVEIETGDPNIVNYGGQPWIPTKNPIGFHNQYN